MEINILSESELEVYTTPDQKTKQRVITYQVAGFAPRALWIDVSKLPDVAWQLANPGKPVPANIQAQGDAARRQAVEADLARLKQVPQPRKI